MRFVSLKLFDFWVITNKLKPCFWAHQCLGPDRKTSTSLLPLLLILTVIFFFFLMSNITLFLVLNLKFEVVLGIFLLRIWKSRFWGFLHNVLLVLAFLVGLGCVGLCEILYFWVKYLFQCYFRLHFGCFDELWFLMGIELEFTFCRSVSTFEDIAYVRIENYFLFLLLLSNC